MTETEVQTTSKMYEISAIGTDDAIAGHIRSILQEAGASVVEEGKAVSIRLAYPIRKQTSGFFVYLTFSALPHAIATIKKNLELNPAVLRLLVVTPPPARPIESGRRTATRSQSSPKTDVREAPALTNEAIEQKIEEILK